MSEDTAGKMPEDRNIPAFFMELRLELSWSAPATSCGEGIE